MDFMKPIVIERLEEAVASGGDGALITQVDWEERNLARLNVALRDSPDRVFALAVAFNADGFCISVSGEAAERAERETRERGHDRLAHTVAVVEAAAHNALSEAGA